MGKNINNLNLYQNTRVQANLKYYKLIEGNFFEPKENYQKLENKINSLGTIKEILNNENLIYQIITYNGDGRLLPLFFNKVNIEMQHGNITGKDLTFFRSGKLIEAIINLEETLIKYGNRDTFLNERMDKINYISLINDIETLIISYTYPTLIDGLCKTANYDEKSYELSSLKTFGTFQKLPKEVQLAIISSVFERGNNKVGQELLLLATDNIKKYPTTNVEYQKYNQQFKKIKRLL